MIFEAGPSAFAPAALRRESHSAATPSTICATFHIWKYKRLSSDER